MKAKKVHYKYAADTSDYVLALSGSEASTQTKERLSKAGHIFL